MGHALIIHEGFGCPESLADRGEKYRHSHDLRYGTARLGPEATDPGGEAEVDVVVTDSPDVADYWKERGVEVEGVATLPEGFPKRTALGQAFLLNEDAVREAALRPAEDPQSLEEIDGIGKKSADEIRKRVGAPPKHEED